jgi:hypothetical protein
MTGQIQYVWLDRYEVLNTLGEGAYGVVYEARDRTSGERVAIKELKHVSAATLARFKQEFRAVQELLHPNLVRLDALFEDAGRWVIAMELIDGKELLDHLYSDAEPLGFDEIQLREAFSQLADGLSALHEAGLVHRDLKPTNVRVTPTGRVVLLDFGLTTTFDPREQSTRMSALGTIAYMAPEQAAAVKVGPAADWYAFGVCLYEALTGVLPLEAETPLALLMAKQHAVCPAASSQMAGIPTDLDELCTALLAIDPAARPGLRSIKSVLTRNPITRSSGPSSALPVDAAVAGAFAGREHELEVLARAFAGAGSSVEPALVMVEGESGIGKSALVERFLSSLKRDVLVLRSRCYENELLAYKAFDGAIDRLARMLARYGETECAALLPPHAALLCKVFPALASVTSLARAPLGKIAADPSIQRLEAFSIFGRLLGRIGERTPIVLVIDDLQWADAESFRLLLAMLRDGQPAGGVIIATVRPRCELEGVAAAGIDELRKLSCTTQLELSGLPHDHARALARELMGRWIPEPWIEVIVKESAGHPLFLTVLARFAESRDPKNASDLTLDAAIEARIGGLSRQACRLLETVAVVGSPLAATLCGQAAGLSESEVAPLVAELCRQKLLRRRRAGELSCFHDRIRRVAVECTPALQTKAMHAAIAKVLAAHGQRDPSELARHYELAGELALADETYRRSAERALSSLAFAQAALLYARALQMSAALQLAPAERTPVMIARGHALARSGRSAEAASQYLEAAETAAGEDKTRLRIWATQHLLQSARIEDGMAAARALLRELGVPLPASRWATLARLMWDRTCLKMTGLRVNLVPAPVASQAQMRLDALWGIALPLSWLGPLASAALNSRHLRLAHALGEPTHMARALAEEAFVRTLQDPEDHEADKLLARARALSRMSTDPAFEVHISFREATVATFRWDLPLARERLEHALRVHAESCPDQPWLLTNLRMTLSAVWANMGEHAQLATSCGAWLAEARERDDQFALSVLEGLGFGFLRHLMADEPQHARTGLDDALAGWPREPFTYAHFGELIGVSYVGLYRGGDSAYLWLERERPRLSQAFMLKLAIGKAGLLTFRAYASLAAYNVAHPKDAAALLAEARSCTQKLRHIKSSLAASHALQLEAQLAALAGDSEAALEKLRQLRVRTEKQSNFFLVHTLGYLEGILEGGDSGRQRQATALAFFAGQGWRQPRRAVAILCPVIDHARLQR